MFRSIEKYAICYSKIYLHNIEKSVKVLKEVSFEEFPERSQRLSVSNVLWQSVPELTGSTVELSVSEPRGVDPGNNQCERGRRAESPAWVVHFQHVCQIVGGCTMDAFNIGICGGNLPYLVNFRWRKNCFQH